MTTHERNAKGGDKETRRFFAESIGGLIGVIADVADFVVRSGKFRIDRARNKLHSIIIS